MDEEHQGAEEQGRHDKSAENAACIIVGVVLVGVAIWWMNPDDAVEPTPPPKLESATVPASDSGRLVCPSRTFPSCDAARNVYFQWRNQPGLHSFEERCRHANAARFLDDSCGGPGDFRVR